MNLIVYGGVVYGVVVYGGIGDQDGRLRRYCLSELERGNYRRTHGSYVSHNPILLNTVFAFHTLNLMHNIRRFGNGRTCSCVL